MLQNLLRMTTVFKAIQKMFSNRIKCLLIYYSLWNFHSIPWARFDRQSIRSLTLLFNIVLCVWCSYSTFTSFLEEESLMEYLDAFNFLLYYINCAVSFWCIIYDSWVKKYDQQKFWDIFLMNNKKFQPKFEFKIKSIITPLLVLIIGDFLILCLTLIRSNSVGSATCTIMHYFFINIFDQRIFFYVFYLKVIAIHLQNIDFQLNEIKKTNPISERQVVLKKIKNIRNSYKCVYEMVEYVNSIFGLSHLALFSISFQSSITFLNFAYRQFHRKFSNYDSGSTFFKVL